MPSTSKIAPPPALNHWLNAGEAPVYLGFGSIPVPDPEKFTRILSQLLEQTQYRILFCQGWSHLKDLPQHPRLYVAETVNHDALFPRCRAAIIHGGIGTIAAALKASLPLVIASIFADQPWWGKIIARRGLGVHLPFGRWTTPGLINAIRAAESPEVRLSVADLGEKIKSENGLAATIEALETHFEHPRNTPGPTTPGPTRHWPTTPGPTGIPSIATLAPGATGPIPTGPADSVHPPDHPTSTHHPSNP